MAVVIKQFGERLALAVEAKLSASCVGIDPHLGRLPGSMAQAASAALEGGDSEQAASIVEEYCLGVVSAVAKHVPAVKPQAAFFEQLGWAGVRALERVVAAAREQGLLVVLDAKRGDIGSTARAYAAMGLSASGSCPSDAMTLSPYLGPESLAPYIDYFGQGAGVFVLVRTSNPGSLLWQAPNEEGIACRVSDWVREQNGPYTDGAGLGPVGAVIGATLREEAASWRARMPRAWFLVPGFGAQGATADDIAPHFREDGLGALITASRSVLYPASGCDGLDWCEQVSHRAEAFAADVRAATPSA
jgi:orotidine-5'-phosphate decarboxylase